MKQKLKFNFDFDTLPNIMGVGIQIIEKELKCLAEKSEEKGSLSETESKLLISYISTLREVKKDYLAEVSSVQKELKSLSTEELTAMLQDSAVSNKKYS